MSRKAPAVQWYTGDFLTGTSLMTNAEVGLYTRMLALQVEKGPLPDDVEAFVKAYGKECRKMWPVVRAKFIAGPIEGTIINVRMASVIADRDAFRKKQSEKGTLSAQLRSTKVQQRKIHGSTKRNGSTVVEPLGDGEGVIRSSGKGTRARNAYAQDFSDAFAAFGSIGNKLTASEAWEKLTPEERTACLAAIPAEVAGTNPDNTFPSRRHFSTYLNQRGWEDMPKPPLNAPTPISTTPRATGWDVKDPTKLSA